MIQAMVRFPSCGVQKNGCGALRNLAFDTDNAATVIQLDGAQVVLDAMQQHVVTHPCSRTHVAACKTWLRHHSIVHCSFHTVQWMQFFRPCAPSV